MIDSTTNWLRYHGKSVAKLVSPNQGVESMGPSFLDDPVHEKKRRREEEEGAREWTRLEVSRVGGESESRARAEQRGNKAQKRASEQVTKRWCFATH